MPSQYPPILKSGERITLDPSIDLSAWPPDLGSMTEEQRQNFFAYLRQVGRDREYQISQEEKEKALRGNIDEAMDSLEDQLPINYGGNRREAQLRHAASTIPLPSVRQNRPADLLQSIKDSKQIRDAILRRDYLGR